MIAAAALAAVAVLLGFAAAHQILIARAEAARDTSRAGTSETSLPAQRVLALLGRGLPERLRRAGIHGISSRLLIACKLAGCLTGGLLASAAAPSAPGRVGLLVTIAVPAAGFLAPDAFLERLASRRRAHLLAALPDALDLLSAGAASGRSLGTSLREAGGGGLGPLSEEIGATAAEMGCGVPQRDALAGLRERVPGLEMAAFCAAVERSRRIGSPLADQLRRQSGDLRRAQRRGVEERAARAAPKIQLVVALVLVPAVLLIIVAGLIANADRLLGGLL